MQNYIFANEVENFHARTSLLKVIKPLQFSFVVWTEKKKKQGASYALPKIHELNSLGKGVQLFSI